MQLAESILVLTGLLTLAMIAAGFSRRLPVPYTVFLVLLGMALGALAESEIGPASLVDLRLTPELVFFVFLPALIFESALNLDARQLLKDIAPILALAIPAMLLSTAVIGVGGWQLLGLSLGVALLFGALIAATDPVAVIAIFKELGAPVRLTTLVEGESLFNDATAIVLFSILLELALADGMTGTGPVGAAIEFVRVFLGGALLGTGIGFAVCELMHRLKANALAIFVMSWVMAYAGFVIAEHELHVSGVMAVVAAAVTMGGYGVTRIPPAALQLTHESWEVIALVANSLLFLLVGMSVDLGRLAGLLPAIAVAALLVLAARALSVYTLVPATTRLFRLPRVALGERHIMWWGGLKGGLAIAIALSIPESLPQREFLIQLTLGVVLVTLLFNAPTIRPLIRLLGIDRLSDAEAAELRRCLEQARSSAHGMLDRFEHDKLFRDGTLTEEREVLDRALSVDADAPAPASDRAHAALEALRIELETLQELYNLDLLEEYAYLELRAEIVNGREAWTSGRGTAAEAGEETLFVRFERGLLRGLREINLLAGLLARYQELRLSQRLQLDIASVITATAVTARLPLEADLDPEAVAEVSSGYHRRADARRARIEALSAQFPEFYRRFEHRLVRQSSLASARVWLEEQHHAGKVGAKVYARIERQLEDAQAHLPELARAESRLTTADLIKRVPLLQDLSADAVAALAERAQSIAFLPGDEVIAEGARGNALYIVVQGRVSVSRTGPAAADGNADLAEDTPEDTGRVRLAMLGPGDFFGEAALLADAVRTASVTAVTPATLLRLTRRDVQAVGESEPDLERALRETDAARRSGVSDREPTARKPSPESGES